MKTKRTECKTAEDFRAAVALISDGSVDLEPLVSKVIALSELAAELPRTPAGAAVGRNLWQHADPAGFATALSAAIHDGASIGEAPGIPGCVRPATGGDGEDRRG